ncbi:MAG TPA: hypothetical protein PKZ76_17640, partial [Xanthomonadaceae bacterium]|nr:hypothetical protein [Xanthomonadaceae bacterium]
RYLESDPIGLAGGVNTFAYARSNPVLRIDLFGLRDVNLLDPRLDKQAYDYAEWYAIDPKEIVVVSHGTPWHLVDRQGNKFDINDVARKVMEHAKYSPEIPIRILGCNAGDRNMAGDDTFAQRLADLLRQLGGKNPVIASDELIYPTTPTIYKEQFRWHVFEGKQP